MTADIVTIIRYGFSFLIGIVLITHFSGLFFRPHALKTSLVITLFSIIMLTLQGLMVRFGSLELTFVFYPLHTHLPIVLFFVLFFRVSLLRSVFSLFVGYMLLQIPNWFSQLINLGIDPYGFFELTVYLLVGSAVIYTIKHTFTSEILDMLCHSNRALAVSSILPMVYFLFDYVTTVWSDLLYSHNWVVSQLMPTIVCVAFIIFLYYISKEQLRHEMAMREKTEIENRLALTASEINSLSRMQEQTRVYRHDMRHHFSLLLSMAEEGLTENIKTYLQENIKDIAGLTPPRQFTSDRMLNMILSNLADRAEANQIKCFFDIRITQLPDLSTTELCAMVSNAIENAINAVCLLPAADREIRVKLSDFNNNLVFVVKNPYTGVIRFRDGLPINSEEGHGLGTKSIVSIVNAHNGQAVFDAGGKEFKLMIIIPIEKR